MRQATARTRRGSDARRVTACVALLVGLLVAQLVAGASGASAAVGSPYFGIGTQAVATPASGGRTLFVSAANGHDTFTYKTATGTRTVNRYSCLGDKSTDVATCPPASASHPLRTMQAGVRSARQGDVVVVRGGTYREAIGWGAKSGTATQRIVLQSYPGERVDVRGTLMLKRVSHWAVRGFHFLHNAEVQTGQAVVNLEGGTGWVFANNEVAGSPGVANVLVTPGAREGTAEARRAAGPRDYTISYNCVRNNRGSHTHGMDHNIYVMAGIYSGGGLIERNLLAGAPNGSHIKAAAAGWSTSQDSPRDLTIRRNTMLAGASGVIVGLNASNIRVQSNLIANPSGSQRWDAAVKLWELKRQDLVSVTKNMFGGYARTILDASPDLLQSGNKATSTIAYSGSVAGCTAVPSNSTVRATYGQRSGL
jgi:hypothetical protein